MWHNTIAPLGGEFNIRAIARPNTEPNIPNILERKNVALKVLDMLLALMTGTTITADIKSRPVIVIEIVTKSATYH